MLRVRLLPRSLVPCSADSQRVWGSDRFLPSCSGRAAGPWDGLCLLIALPLVHRSLPAEWWGTAATPALKDIPKPLGKAASLQLAAPKAELGVQGAARASSQHRGKARPKALPGAVQLHQELGSPMFCPGMPPCPPQPRWAKRTQRHLQAAK